MAITFKYNGRDVFDGISRAPLLSRSEEIIYTGQNIARGDRFVLSGQIKRVECNGGFEEAYNLTKDLILGFSENFKRFQILDGSNTIFDHQYTIVQSISIDEDKYYDLIPFSISLLCYKDSFAEAHGILEPNETWDYQENEDETVSITHTVSARGLNNSSMALANARTFVSGRAGYSTSLAPSIFGFTVDNPPILLNRSTNINSFTAEVSLNESYVWDKSNRSASRSYALIYQLDSEVNDGVISIALSGTVQGSLDSNIEITRVGFAAIDFFAIANTEYKALYDASGSLPLIPTGFSIDESRDTNTISFSYAYTNDTNTDPYVVDETTITRQGAEHCISVSLQIKSDRGCPAERLRKTKAYLATFDLDAYMASKWATYGTGKVIGSNPNQRSVSFDNLTGTVGLSATICSRETEDCGCLENLRYSIKVSPAIPQLSEEPSYQGAGCYAIQDLNYNRRSKISISGSARPAKCCSNEAVKSQIYTRVHQLLGEYFVATDIILENAQIEISNDRSVTSFGFSWNGLQSSALPDAYFYATF